MSEKNSIPVINKTTGETSYATPLQNHLSNLGEKSTPASKNEPHSESDPRVGLTTEPSARSNQTNTKRITATREKRQGTEATPKGNTHPKFENLEKFIAHAYARRGLKVALTPAVEKQLCRQPKLDPEAKARLMNLAKTDFLLTVPRQLLLLFRDIVGFPTIKNTVREFVGEVLAQHSIFSQADLSLVIKNLPDSPSPEQALAIIGSLELTSLPEDLQGKIQTPKALQELRVNLAYCLAVWFAETRAYGLDRLCHLLFATLWRPAAYATKGETSQLRMLTQIEDLAGVGLAASIFKQQASEQVAAATAARKAQDNLQDQVNALLERIQSMQTELQERDTQIMSLNQTLAEERQRHSHTRIHLGDEHEQLRTRVLRRLKSESSLLADGLHALRRDPPKIHVMEDHADRALEGLKKEIRELEQEK